MQASIQIRQLCSLDDPVAIATMTDILVDCVDGGASVSFMHPLSRARAEVFWRSIAASIAAGERALLVAQDEDAAILGTVQVVLSQPENQPHRADVAKLLVHRRARQAGVGTALITAAEKFAARVGKTLLVLDTATGGEAERLYARLGWQVSGIIPDYAMWPDGRMAATTIFYKNVGNTG